MYISGNIKNEFIVYTKFIFVLLVCILNALRHVLMFNLLTFPDVKKRPIANLYAH